MSERMKQKEIHGKRFQYVPLDQISLEEVKSRDAKTNNANLFVQRLKEAEGKAKKGVWISTEQPSYLVLDEKIAVVKPEELEEKVKQFSLEFTSRMMTLSEALFTLEWIRQELKEEVKVEDFTSTKGMENSIVPYMTNRENVLLVKAEKGYALLGSGEYFREECPCTHVSYIVAGEHIDKTIKPIMVLEE